MSELKTAIFISLAFIMLYTILFLLDIWKKGASTGVINPVIAKFMSEYNVNVRTFYANGFPFGFAWFKTIWINERLLKKKKLTLWTLHHEYCHYKHKHKQKVLISQYSLSLVPLLTSLINWSNFDSEWKWLFWIGFILVFITLAIPIHYLRESFEKQANKYAAKMIKND